MTKDLTTIIEEWIEKQKYVSDTKFDTETLERLKSKIPQLVENVVELVKETQPRDEYIDQLGALEMKFDIIKSLTGKNI